MHFSSQIASFLPFLLISSTALAQYGQNSACPPGSAIEGLTQAGYKTAWTIDSKNWTRLNEVFTQDVYYDSTALGQYGGKTEGIEQTREALQKAGEGAKTSHVVTNLYVEEMMGPEKARVITYITVTHWDLEALDDINKTFRVQYYCDDIWVCEDHAWKMQHSVVTNLGVGVEAPYNTQVVPEKAA
ncbi:hypothetical protein CKM354_000467000 [Cercospora kikuchii]|uniref:SnoaL-like domain-containing protein n=1 Tax=Cercospora kikuchii TaxID=84275 RepID=A0A9P3CBV4_9PEZI|nr:uncharacterized protein CKM354_000467000 [Cercospora kikuchii]GIZ41364.1 hypothetical protein CKM354_000467000 [Cercospora kikuchii]